MLASFVIARCAAGATLALLVAACATDERTQRPAGTDSATLVPTTTAAPGFHDLTIKDQGVERVANVYVPSHLIAGRKAPTIFCLANNSSKSCIEQGRWTALADREGVILVGIGGSGGWNEGSGRGRAAAAGIDDVAFLNRLLDQVLERYPADPTRVYATGFSMSGGMVFRMAVDMGNRLAAVASHSSAYWMGQRNLTSAPNVMFIVGDSDENNPMNGGGINTQKKPISETIDAWRSNLGVANRAPKLTQSNGATRSIYGPNLNGAVFEYILVAGLGHTWAGGQRNADRQAGVSFDSTEEIWSFFKAHSRCDLKPAFTGCIHTSNK